MYIIEGYDPTTPGYDYFAIWSEPYYNNNPIMLFTRDANADRYAANSIGWGDNLIDGLWHHVMITWDLIARTTVFVIDGLSWHSLTVDEDGGMLNLTNCNEWGIAAFGGGHLAEFWFAPGLHLDITDASVQAKFRTASNTPADLGMNGELPTGSPPILYLSQRSSDWNEFFVNRGFGGGTFVRETSHSYDQYGSIEISDRDPSIENPSLQITGNRGPLTMRSTRYPALDLHYESDTEHWGELANTQGITGVGGFLVPQNLRVYDDSGVYNGNPAFQNADQQTVVAASFAMLGDDGKSVAYSRISQPYPADAINGNFFYTCHNGTTVYVATLVFLADNNDAGTSTPSLSVTILNLDTNPLTSIGPISAPSPSWMADEFSPILMPFDYADDDIWRCPNASIINWDGKEQCVLLMSSLAFDGRAIMVDSSGNFTEAKIWDGCTVNERLAIWGDLIATIQTIPLANGNNSILVTCNPESDWVVMTRLVEADQTGHQLSSYLVHADDLYVDSLLQGGYYFDDVDSSLIPWAWNLTTDRNGYFIAGALDFSEDKQCILRLNPVAKTYTMYDIVPDPNDATAMHLLTASRWPAAACYFSDNHHYLMFNEEKYAGVLWDGPSFPVVPNELKLIKLPARATDTTPKWPAGWTVLPQLRSGEHDGTGGAYAISADGSTVVGFVENISGDRGACYWTAVSGPIVISLLDYSEAYGVSSDGSVIAGNTENQPFIWQRGDTSVTTFGTGNDVVNGMSADASTMIGTTLSGGNWQACKWDRNFVRTNLGFLPGHNYSEALGVSADGSYIVGDSRGGGSSHAFRWSAATGMVNLGVTGGATSSVAFGVSNDGGVVAVNQNDFPVQPGIVNKAAKWTPSGGLVQLPVLIPVGTLSGHDTQVIGISGDGSTIIGSSDYIDAEGNLAYRSCLAYWTVDGIHVPTPGVFEYPEVPASMYPNQNGITQDGSIIVGWTWGGIDVAWLYNRNPPPPSSEYFALNSSTADFPSSFGKFSISMWCCGEVDLQGPDGFTQPGFQFLIRPSNLTVNLNDNAGNILFFGYFFSPGPVNEEALYHLAFSIDIFAHKVLCYVNGAAWSSTDATFLNDGGIDNIHVI